MSAKVLQLTLTGTGGYTTDLPKSNFIATTDPGVGDDDVDGYVSGSQWWNITSQKMFACMANTTGAAVWIQCGPGTTGSAGADGFPGGFTFLMTWRSGTGPSGSTGEFKFNNATVASVTALYSAKTDRSSVSLTAVLNSVVKNDIIKVWKKSDQTKWAIFAVTVVTDNTTYQTFTVTHVASNSTFSDTDVICFSIAKAGPTGASGALGGVVGTNPSLSTSTGLRTSGAFPTVGLSTNSDDQAGVLLVTPGGAPAVSALALTVTFSAAYANTPKSVTLTPGNAAAQALLSTGAFPYVNDADTTASLFKIYSSAVALTAATAYRFQYAVHAAG